MGLSNFSSLYSVPLFCHFSHWIKLLDVFSVDFTKFSTIFWSSVNKRGKNYTVWHELKSNHHLIYLINGFWTILLIAWRDLSTFPLGEVHLNSVLLLFNTFEMWIAIVHLYFTSSFFHKNFSEYDGNVSRCFLSKKTKLRSHFK